MVRDIRDSRRLLAAVLLVLLVGSWTCSSARAKPPEPAGDEGDAAVERLAATIDRHLAARWRSEGVTPAEPADDAEFLRRTYLNLTGAIPPVSEVRRFLADDAPDKRRRMVEKLLAGPGHLVHFARFWRRVLIPEAENDRQVRYLAPGFEAWLRQELRAETPYNELVRKIITAPLEGPDGPRNVPARLAEPSPLAFYQAKKVSPANLAAATSRIFLGVRIECAQCHDHPFDDWEREDFWSYAAFFAGIERQEGRGIFGQIRELPDRRELAVGDTGQVVQAAYLDGSTPRWRYRVGARETLADWIVSAENPYFARAAVNRLWAHFFGPGLVDPVDDFSDANPPSHPELLDALSEAFVASGFDVKFMIRAITASKAYQLSSRVGDAGPSDPRLFARMATRGLTAEQLLASFRQATGDYQPYQGGQEFAQGRRGDFLETFADDSPTSTTRSTTILQALAMMNGPQVAQATNLGQSRTLGAVAEAPFLDAAQKIETLYLAALSRMPTEDERRRMLTYVEKGGVTGDKKQALADVFWALLNSGEFMFNH